MNKNSMLLFVNLFAQNFILQFEESSFWNL